MENEEHRQIDAEHNNGGDGRVCTAQKTLENDRARLYDLYHMYAGKLISVCLFISTYFFYFFIYRVCTYAGKIFLFVYLFLLIISVYLFISPLHERNR